MKKLILIVAILTLVLTAALALSGRQEVPKPISLDEFNSKIGRNEKTVLVYFHADWCMLCAKMQPHIQNISTDYKNKIEFLLIDVDRDKEVAEEFEANSLPMFMLYQNGVRKWTRIGFMQEYELRKKLDSYVYFP